MIARNANFPSEQHTLRLPQDEFIFRVESTGVLPPEDIVSTALEVLQQKLNTITLALQARKEEGGEGGEEPMQWGPSR